MDSAHEILRGALLDPAEAAAMKAPGGTEAAVLVPIFGHPATPAWCSRSARRPAAPPRGDLLSRRSPGRAGRGPDGDRPREAEEEIGLDPGDVELVGALPPVGTFVTGYKVHPFVGLIPEDLPFGPNPAEVAAMLLFRLEELRGGFAMRRLVRRGMPIRTPTYVVGEHLIWGATARILGELLDRVDG